MRWHTLIAAWKRASADHLPLIAAGVAFYGFLSLFPALIAGISMYGLIASPETVTAQSAHLTEALPADAASLVSGQMQAIASTAGGSLGAGMVVALLAAMWSASTGIGNLVSGLNIAFGCTDRRDFLRRKLLALALTLGAMVFVPVTIALVAAASPVLDRVGPWRWPVDVGRWLLLFAAVVAALTVLYRLAPDRQITASRGGTLAAAAIWLVASVGLSTYIDNFGSYSKTYGTLAGVAALLLWLWVGAYAVLFGAVLETMLETTGS